MHAVLITAYKDFPALQRLVRRLDPAFFKTFIHIDRKSRFNSGDVEVLKALGAVVTSTYVIRWGSHTHLLAILHLMRLATAQGSFEYLHLISGQDYPLWPADEFKRRCDRQIFLDYRPLEHEPALVRDRYELGDPFHFLLTHRAGSRAVHKFLSRKSHFLRSRLSKRRSQFGPYGSLFKALVWSSIPTTAAERILNDPVAQDFLWALRNTSVAEEVFFATYFLNCDLAPLVVKNDLRYTDWRERNGSKPAYLDHSDIEDVLRSGALFARKVSSSVSIKLLDMIDEQRFGSSRG
jgi:hypothetical protein